MHDRNLKVQSYFHRSAAKFDRLYNRTNIFTFWINRLFRKALYMRTELVLKECYSSCASSVLEVGSGSGVNAVQLARNGIKRVLGVDYAEGMTRLAKAKLPQELESAVEYVYADFMKWDTGEKFDCVVALGVFDYLDDPAPFLSKMCSYAKEKVMFSVPGKLNLRQYIRAFRYRLKACPIYFYGRDDIEKLVEIPGWRKEIHSIGSSGFLCVMTAEK